MPVRSAFLIASGPRMGAVNQPCLPHHLTGTTSMTIQIFDATVQDNRHVDLKGLEQGAWKPRSVDLARESHRADGTHLSAFAAGNQVGDFFFLRSSGQGLVELLVDDVTLYDAGRQGS